MEASAIAAEGPIQAKFRDQKFDIRNGFRFSLIESDTIVPAEKEYRPEEK